MTTLLADAAAADPYHHGLSLLRGWLPIVIQLVTAAILIAATGWRTRRWRLLWLPLAVLVGVAAAAWANWFIDSQGMADDPAPDELWVWIGLSGLAIGVAVFGFTSAAWWRRGVSVLAVATCLLSAALAVNLWVGYFPTVQTAWNQLTAGPLPDETDLASVQAQKASHTVPAHGAVVPVTIPADASGFKHREELVYLPPAWFAGNTRLPTVMMIGGEFNTPADWLRTGDAAAAMDGFAAAHGGNAPVFVFVDSGGSFNNDTECVNGPRGNVADHLTKDVVPYMNSTFGVNPAAAGWGIVGWSMGGTCAVDLTVMHPDLFSAFVDIAGDLGPVAGTKDQTVARLFGGSAAAWSQFDPTTVMNAHPSYRGVSGWFQISSDAPTQHKGNQAAAEDAVGLGGRDAGGNPGDQTAAAHALCELGASKGMDCAVIASPGKHDWPFAKAAFTASLPWLAAKLGTPGVAPVGFPAAGAVAPTSVAEPASGK
ncbi:MAG: esterase family protein [Mycolicibacterium cosmeticum]|nr:esterase family protein [Mycolicibacterium cosmeticum]